MKNPSLILSIVSLIVALTFGILYLTVDKTGDSNAEAPAYSAASVAMTDSTVVNGGIAYINLDLIISEYDMANDLRAVVGNRIEKIDKDVTQKGKKLENDVKKFQEDINKGVLLPSVAKKKQEELMKAEQEFNQYAAQKQQEMQQEEIVMMNQIADAIKTFIDKYNAEMQYAMIFANNGGTPVITGNPALDITEDVLARLNQEYVNSKK